MGGWSRARYLLTFSGQLAGNLLKVFPKVPEEKSHFEIVYHQREAVATLWDAHAWLWHGYELRGLEHLPTQVVDWIMGSELS